MTRRNILLGCTALLALTACSSSLGPTEPSFGAHYQIAAEPAPFLSGAILTVTLQYSGCNGGHDFGVFSRTRDLTAEVWLQKRTPDQTCDMLVTETRGFELPASVSLATSVTLLAPNGEFTIR